MELLLPVILIVCFLALYRYLRRDEIKRYDELFSNKKDKFKSL